jgi:hypothetical protein
MLALMISRTRLLVNFGFEQNDISQTSNGQVSVLFSAERAGSDDQMS